MAKRFGVDLQISRLVLLIGLMCERLQRFEEGEQILRAMKAYRDDLPHPGTYLALCYISQGRLRDALEELEVVRTRYPDFQMGKVLLGIAQRDAGNPGWRELLQEVIDQGREEYAVRLAQETLGLDPGVAVESAAPSNEKSAADLVPHAHRVYA
jgi:tetratricopeptide (TPR) repeat protein